MIFKLLENDVSNEKSTFYTNGVVTIKLKPSDEIPDGFYKGRTFNSNPWNKGKTAETDARVKQNVDAAHQTRRENGSYSTPRNKGETKDTNEILAKTAEKVSIATKGRIAHNKGIPSSEETKQKQSIAMKGKVPYNKGLTKDTCPSLQSASDKLKGHPCFVTDWNTAKQKEYITKKLNHSFNSSAPEKKLISDLIEIYGEDDVLHPYRDERYPFNCDVYIKSLDLFIEFNGTIEHYGHPFDENNPADIEEKRRLQQLVQLKGEKSRYKNILDWWTEIDPKKLKTFRENHLNFEIIYPNNLIIKN